MSTLRGRLVLSHVLPFLIVIPLMGIALIYVLQNQVLLPSLGTELREETALATELAAEHPDIWTDRQKALAFVARLDPDLTARAILLDTNGHILASTEETGTDLPGQTITSPGLTEAEKGRTGVKIASGGWFGLDTEVADVFSPVKDADGKVIGIVRLTHHLGGVYERFERLRYVVAAILAIALVLGAFVGWFLALNLTRPLRNLTVAAYNLANGRQMETLHEQGPAEIRTLLRAFNTMVGRLQNAEETRRKLIANLVHELGRPLGAFYSALQALLRGADEDTQLRRDILAGMSNEVQGMSRLLDDLTGLHTQAFGHIDLQTQPTDICEWLPGVLGSWRQSALDKGLNWQADIPTSLPITMIDPDKLAQAVGNLLSNAIKYTSTGGTISVSAGGGENEVWIEVADTGTGIEEEEQPRIFDPFYRSSKHPLYPEGMGLGLGITRELVQAHGGTLKLHSVPGQGSSFTIHLLSSVKEPAHV